MDSESRLRVVVINAHYPNYETEREILSPFRPELAHIDTGGDLERLIEAVKNADAVLTRETLIPREAIEAMERCKVIVRYGVGVDNIDLVAARQRRIYVANVPSYGSDEVADHAVALLMAVARRIVTRDKDVRNGAWGIGAKEKIYSFRDRTLGIVGYGRIGRAFHRKVSGLGFYRVLVYDPFVAEKDGSYELVDMETLCSQSDVISLHAPLTTENRHLIDEAELEAMKPNAILINTSRGGLVNDGALVKVLKEKKIFGAGIDVFESEPPGRTHPIFNLKNVIVTDHTGWYSEESLQDLQRKAAQEVARVFSEKQPLSWVNDWED